MILIREISHPTFIAFESVFNGMPEVKVEHGPLFEFTGPADAVVSPANSFGFMDGGVDAYICAYLGWHVQEKVREQIAGLQFCELLVGEAIVVPIDHAKCKNIIVAPTMRVPSPMHDASGIFLAARAAMRAALDAEFKTVVFPPMGTGAGQIPANVAAQAMKNAFNSQFPGRKLAPPSGWREAYIRHTSLIG